MCIMYFHTYVRAFVGFDIMSNSLMHSYGSFTINIHILGKESRANTEKPGTSNKTLTHNYVQQNARWAEHVVRYVSGREEVHTEF